uniref:hypothetical protein n=1 Tax=Prevotella sp. TaxID=59823 RepID=UPI004029B0C6
MTREEAKEMLPIIQAFAEGKEIEFRSKGFDEEWKKVNEIPGLSYSSFDYRVKPEPKYRPFKNVDECWQEMLKHQPFGWIKSKTGGHYSMVTVVGADEKMKSIAISGRHIWPFDETLSNYTFADGTPFGIKEEH